MKKIVFSAFIFLVLSVTACGWGGEDMDAGKLPEPQTKGTVSLEETIEERRSERGFSQKPLREEQIGQLLWASQGITDPRGLRASPSAGATYPLEVYYLTEDGVFQYLPRGHRYRKILGSDRRDDLSRASLGQTWVKEAPFSLVICAVYERTTKRYGERGEMYTHIEVGHAAQNVHLQAVALGLVSVPVGAFREKEVAKILNLPQEEIPLYIIPVGYKK